MRFHALENESRNRRGVGWSNDTSSAKLMVSRWPSPVPSTWYPSEKRSIVTRGHSDSKNSEGCRHIGHVIFPVLMTISLRHSVWNLWLHSRAPTSSWPLHKSLDFNEFESEFSFWKEKFNIYGKLALESWICNFLSNWDFHSRCRMQRRSS